MKQDSTFKRSGTSPAGSAPSELRGFAALAGSHPSTENDKSRFWRWVATMMYGLWRVAGREQKGACGIPPACWVWSEDLELFKFLFTKTWLGGGVVWFSGKWSDRSAGDLLQGLSGQLCEGRKNRHFHQTNCYCFLYMWLLVGPLKKSLEGTEGKISHLSFFRVRK